MPDAVAPAGAGELTRLTVSVPGGDYPVLIGEQLLDRVPELLAGAARVAVLHSEALPGPAAAVAAALRDAGREVVDVAVPDGEAAKHLRVAETVWERLGAAGFTRSDALVAVGGGAVTDLGGFAAACWLRGVRVVQVPTSMLAMVDAAVGGKTGVNTGAGKNLVGAFHQPAAVVCDLALLDTLPEAELRSGLAEVVKCGFIADPGILDLLAEEPDPGPATLRELVVRAVAVKARVVGSDEREAGLREVLNYGHTLAHAIERVEDYTWRHGDAVAVGMVWVAEVARRLGRLDDATAARHRQVLEAVGLPTSYPGGDWAELRAVMAVDKKARGATLRLVVLDGLARPGVLDGPPEAELAAAFEALNAAVPAGATAAVRP